MGATVPKDEVVGVEAMAGIGQQEKGGSTQRMGRLFTVGKGPGGVVSGLCKQYKAAVEG